MSLPGRKEYDVVARNGKPARARRLSEDPLAPVSVHRIAQPLRCNKGDSAQVAFITLESCDADEPVTGPLSAGEDPLKLRFGFDGLHGVLDGKTLATLGTAAGKDGAAVPCCHAGAEAVGLCALPLVGLIRALHDEILLDVNVEPIASSPKIVGVRSLKCQFFPWSRA